jgi:hypothetical protein
MSDYFTAHRKRMEGIDQLMKNYSEQLKQLGCKVYGSKNGLISFIKIEKDNKHCIFGFTDIPYRFYIQINIDYGSKIGNCRTVIEDNWTTTNWTPEFIMSKMANNPKKFDVSYLKEL